MDTELGAAPLVPQDPQDPQVQTMRDGLRQAIRDTGDDIAGQFDQRLQSNFALAIRTKPELAAEAQDIARQLGVAPGAVEGNLDVAREAARRRAFRQRDFARTHPVLATALQDIEFAKVAQDDLDHLAGTEGFFQRLGMAWDLGKLKNAQGYAGARLLTSQLRGQPEDVVDQRRLEWIRDSLMTLPESQGILQNTFEVLGLMSETVPVALGAGAAAGQVASLGGPISAGTAAAIGTGTALFGQTAVIEGGNAYAEMVAQGLDKDAAARASIGVGLVNGALELVGEELTFGLAAGARRALASRVTKQVAEALVAQTAGKAALKAAGRYATGVAAEVSTEVLQEVTNVLAERAAGGDPQDIEQRLVDIAVKTAQGMALLGAVNPGTRFAIDARRAARARQLQETFTQPLVDAATASTTAQRAPDAFRSFVQQAAQGTGGETAYIDGRRFGEVLQQLKVTDDQLEEAVPGITDQIQTAIETGGDVVLPTADLAAKLGRTDLLTALAPHVRLDPDAMSFADAEAFQAAQKEQQQAAATAVESEATRSQDFRRSLEQVRTQMRDELRTTIRELRDEVAKVGKDAKKGQRLREADAGALATVYANTIGSLAMRAGMLPHEFAARYPLQVLRPTESSANPSGTQMDALQQNETGDSGAEAMDAESRPRDNASRDVQPGTSIASAPNLAEGEAGGSPGVPGPGQSGEPAIPAGNARWGTRSDVRGTYAARTDLAELHTREIGAERVTSVADAAQALAYLGRGADERFDALVTDADDNPLAIVGSFKGGVAHATISVPTLVAEAFRIKGAARIWFAHNHPSGSVVLSSADRAIHARLIDSFSGSTITPVGLFAIGGGASEARSWVFESSASPGSDLRGTVQPSSKTVKVPVLERVIASDGRLGPALRGPVDAHAFAKIIANGEAGAVLLDTQHRPLAFLPITPEEAVSLRKNGRMDAMYRAVSVANASRVVLVNNATLSDAAVHNLGRFFHSLEIETLDVVDVTGDDAASWSALGKAVDVAKDTFKSGSRGSFDPKTLRLFLSTEADPTTFLHELSHFYLSILGDLAARPDAPAAITADMETLLQWWGVPDLSTWNSMTLEQQRKHHEAFAYSFEGYLFDGKAPSAALRRVFGRIAAWFRQVYRGLRDRINRVYREAFGADLPALTPEVRAVFDRMLASEDEIAAAQQVHGMAAVFESQAQAGATDAQWADYLAAQEDATNAAIDEHSRDSLRQMQWLTGARSRVLRELQAQHKALRVGVREDVEAELRVQPVHRARQWLVHGEMVDVDGTSAGKVDGVHKIDLEALRPYLPAGAEKRVTGRNGIAVAKGGMDPATAATLFGFPDAATMVRELLAAPKLEDAVEAATDERMLEEHGDLADPKRRERLVEEALHNELRTRQIAVEQRLLTKAAQPVRVLTAAAKEAAERIVGRQKVWLVDPKAHSVAEARAGRDIGEALRKGDAVAAVAAQRNRMLQHQLVKAAVQALDDVQTAEEQAAQFYERDDQVSERRDIDLVYVGRALAARWGFGPKLQGQEQQLAEKALAAVRADNPQLASMIDGWIDRQTAQGGTYREMKVADLRELHTVLEGVWSLAGEAKTIEIEGRRAQVKAAGERLAMHIAEKPERAPSASAAAGATPSPWARLVLKGWNVFAHLKRFTFWARFMDGAAAGPFHDYFVQPILAATQRYRAARDEMVSAVHPRILELRSAAGSRWDADIAAPELGHTFRGKKEIVGALLHAGSHSNLEKLLVGYGWAEPPKEGEVLDTSKWDRFLARMFQEGVLTQQDTEFAAFIWGLYAKQLPENQRTHKALYGFEFHAIEHRQVRTPFGVLEGGYVPAYADRDATDLRLGQIADTIEGDAAAFTYSVSTGRGHTLARNPFYRKPLALDLAQQVRHMDAQLRFTFVQPALKGVMRVVRQRDFSNAMNAYDREAVNSIILPWLENVALQATTRPSGMPLIDTAATMLRRVSSLAALGFNLGNALIQSTGIANSIAVVKGRWMRAGLAAMSNPAAALRFATERSAWMQDRLSQRAETMREDIQRAGSEQPLPFLPADFVRGWKATSRALGRAALLPQRFTQGFVDLVTWHGAYQQAMAEAEADGTVTLEEAEKRAVEAADGAVRHTQGGGGPEDLAAYEAGTPVMKLLTQFGSYSNVVLNSILAAGDTRTQRAAAALWVLLVPAVLEPTIRMLLVGAPDDDDGDGRMDELAALYAGGVVRNVVGLVPGAGPMALAMAESDGKRVLSSPAASTMQAAFRGVAGLADMVTGERAPTGADARAWAQLMTMLTGMPLVPVGRAAGYALDVEAGKRKPTGTADYLRGLVVGR